jgi:hypothetical protein
VTVLISWWMVLQMVLIWVDSVTALSQHLQSKYGFIFECLSLRTRDAIDSTQITYCSRRRRSCRLNYHVTDCLNYFWAVG